jgi:hypothetical protein
LKTPPVVKACEKSIPRLKVSVQFLNRLCVVASYPEKRIFVGNLIKIDKNNNTIIPENLQTKINNLQSEDRTIVAVFH